FSLMAWAGRVEHGQDRRLQTRTEAVAKCDRRRFTNRLLVVASYDLDDAPHNEHSAENGERSAAVGSAQGQRPVNSTADEDQSDDNVPHGALVKCQDFEFTADGRRAVYSSRSRISSAARSAMRRTTAFSSSRAVLSSNFTLFSPPMTFRTRQP